MQIWSPHTNMRVSRFFLKTCTGQSSAAWHLLTRPNTGRAKHIWFTKNILSSSCHSLNERVSSNLFKFLLEVCVRLQFDLPAGVGPVHQEQPLLSVHLFDKDGRFFVVPHLKINHRYVRHMSLLCIHTHMYELTTLYYNLETNSQKEVRLFEQKKSIRKMWSIRNESPNSDTQELALPYLHIETIIGSILVCPSVCGFFPGHSPFNTYLWMKTHKVRGIFAMTQHYKWHTK